LQLASDVCVPRCGGIMSPKEKRRWLKLWVRTLSHNDTWGCQGSYTQEVNLKEVSPAERLNESTHPHTHTPPHPHSMEATCALLTVTLLIIALTPLFWWCKIKLTTTINLYHVFSSTLSDSQWCSDWLSKPKVSEMQYETAIKGHNSLPLS